MLSTFLQTHARVAFIGTGAFTALSEPIRTLFAQAATLLAERRVLIVTGAAGGADQAAATTALAAGVVSTLSSRGLPTSRRGCARSGRSTMSA